MNRDPYKILFYTTLILIVAFISVHYIQGANSSTHEAIDRTLVTMDDETQMMKIDKTYDIVLTGKELIEDLSFNCTVEGRTGHGLYHVSDVSDSYSHLRPLVGERLLRIDGVDIKSTSCTPPYDFSSKHRTDQSYTVSFDVSNTLMYMNPEYYSLATFSPFASDISTNMISFFNDISGALIDISDNLKIS